MASIAVLGAGSWGTALATVLANNHHHVLLWARDETLIADLKKTQCNQKYLPNLPLPNQLNFDHDLTRVLDHADHVLIAVPSHAFADLITQIKNHITTEQTICWATKGLDSNNSRFLHEIVEQEFSNEYAVLSGPSFAKEVVKKMPTAVTIAGYNSHVAKLWQQFFHNDYFRVYTSQDVVGVEIAASVKNVLAIAAGINDGLNFGVNARSALITRGLAEMLRLGEKLGAIPETFMGLSGLGDLILTCSDDQSRNRRLGLCLGRGLNLSEAQAEIKQTIEGIQTTKLIHDLAKRLNVDMPICKQVYNVLYQNVTPRDAVKVLLARDPKAE